MSDETKRIENMFVQMNLESSQKKKIVVEEKNDCEDNCKEVGQNGVHVIQTLKDVQCGNKNKKRGSNRKQQNKGSKEQTETLPEPCGDNKLEATVLKSRSKMRKKQNDNVAQQTSILKQLTDIKKQSNQVAEQSNRNVAEKKQKHVKTGEPEAQNKGSLIGQNNVHDKDAEKRADEKNGKEYLSTSSCAEKSEELLEAAKEGLLLEVALLISEGGDVGFVGSDGWTPLHWAVYYGYREVAEALIAAGAPVGARDNFHNTPLHIAAGSPHSQMLLVLLRARAPLESRDKDGATALHCAVCRSAHLEALLAVGANPNARDNCGETPLHRAARYCQDRSIVSLLLSGADVNLANSDFQTPLHLAIHDNPSCLIALLGNGSNIQARDRAGNTPLHVAVRLHCVPSARELYYAGADPRIPNKDGLTPREMTRDSVLRCLLSIRPLRS